MKKRIAIPSIILILSIMLSGCVRIRSVDDYYANESGASETGDMVVFFSIRCDTVLAHYEELDPSLQSEEYIPADGVILKRTAFAMQEGDTVFDLLVRASRENQIALDWSGTPAVGVYVRGIHHLYEFSCGALSGWMYSVNSTFPQVACSAYRLSDGDEIAWVYSCDLGQDVGDSQTETVPDSGEE